VTNRKSLITMKIDYHRLFKMANKIKIKMKKSKAMPILYHLTSASKFSIILFNYFPIQAAPNTPAESPNLFLIIGV
jgi:hypothetical protein